MWGTNCSTGHTVPAPQICTKGNANSGGRYNISVSDVRGTVAPSPAIYIVALDNEVMLTHK